MVGLNVIYDVSVYSYADGGVGGDGGWLGTQRRWLVGDWLWLWGWCGWWIYYDWMKLLIESYLNWFVIYHVNYCI